MSSNPWLTISLAFLTLLGTNGVIVGLVTMRANRTKIGTASKLDLAQIEVALSADARAWVEEYADDARAARVEATECRAEVRLLRTHVTALETWAQRNVRPDAEPMPRLVWPLPAPTFRPAD